jgi:hypothetical protein
LEKRRCDVPIASYKVEKCGGDTASTFENPVDPVYPAVPRRSFSEDGSKIFPFEIPRAGKPWNPPSPKAMEVKNWRFVL